MNQAGLHPGRILTLACPGLYQHQKGERLVGTTFLGLAAACLTIILYYGRLPADPFGRNTVRLAIAGIVLFWGVLFSILDAFQKPGRSVLYLILLPAISLFSVFTYLPIL
jgi:hypothetical protein